jgi:apolipoprotein N-acyltransferase
MMFKKQFLALICGLIFSFGFAPFDYWLLSILSISVLYKTIKGMPPKEAFYTGYWFGFGMWLTGISWLYVSIHYHGEISIIGSALLILIFISILSIYSGLLLLLNSNLEKYGFQKLIYLSLPVSWVLIELIRSYLFTGFPWLISGTMLADTLIDGYTPIIGAQGNTFFLVLIGVLLCEIYESFSQKRTALFPIIFLFIVLVPSSVLKNIEWTIPDNELKVSLHQPNLTLEDKWSQFGVIKTHGMIQRAIDDATEGELIVFPRNSFDSLRKG